MHTFKVSFWFQMGLSPMTLHRMGICQWLKAQNHIPPREKRGDRHRQNGREKERVRERWVWVWGASNLCVLHFHAPIIPMTSPNHIVRKGMLMGGGCKVPCLQTKSMLYTEWGTWSDPVDGQGDNELKAKPTNTKEKTESISPLLQNKPESWRPFQRKFFKSQFLVHIL